MHTIFTCKETLLISLSFKKNLNFRPKKYGHLKKRGFREFGTANFTAVEIGRELRLKSGVAKLFFFS
jgi:hypothetical protein